MPLRRSPPPPATSNLPAPAASGPSQSCDSDTPSERSDRDVACGRLKRRREHDDDIKDLKNEMRELFLGLSKSMDQKFNEVMKQNSELQTSLQFMSDKYDSLLEKVQNLDEMRNKDKMLISILEEKIETMERKIKNAGFEIRNVPKSSKDGNRPETKSELCSLVMSLADNVNIGLQESDIKDVYRVNSNKDATKPIIVELNSVLKKENILQEAKKFNRNKPKEDKLNTSHLKLSGCPPRPIFVSETLTFKTQKLFYMAREFARDNGYTYCWTSRGLVYLRKADGLPFFRVESEADLFTLRNKM